MTIAAVVVTYNRKALLKQCIEHILMQEGEEPDILVVDNHSTDGTKELIKSFMDSNRIDYVDTGLERQRKAMIVSGLWMMTVCPKRMHLRLSCRLTGS